MGYDAETTQREITKEKEAWMVAIGAVVSFIIIGVIVWSTAGR